MIVKGHKARRRLGLTVPMHRVGFNWEEGYALIHYYVGHEGLQCQKRLFLTHFRRSRIKKMQSCSKSTKD